LIGPKG